METAEHSDVRLVYHHNYYDYPRSGVVTWRGERYWFDESTTEGTFNLYELPAERWTRQDERHAAFQEHVGTHCDYEYDENGVTYRRLGAVRPGSEHSKFYGNPRWQRDQDPSIGLTPVATWTAFDIAVNSPS